VAPTGGGFRKNPVGDEKSGLTSSAGGQDHLKGKSSVLVTWGFVSDRDILAAVASLEATLREVGYEGFTFPVKK
jgi:aspartate aminotransferase-like enzyme